MTHSGSYHHRQRRQPSRSTTKDSWITIDWGERPDPSHVHGILDQIAGYIIRDPALVQQGKDEWKNASRISDKKRRGHTSGGSRRIPANHHSRSRGAGGKSSPKNASSPSLLGSLFGSVKRKPQPTSGTLRRALSKPGQHSYSRSANVSRRPTDRSTRQDSSRRPRR